MSILKPTTRMKTKSLFIILSCIAAVLFAPLSAFAAEKKKSASESPAPSASPAAAAAKAPRPIPFHGMVSAVDQSAKTFTIAGKTATRVFKVSDRTEIMKGAGAGTFSDIVANEEVSGSYWKAADGSLEAKKVKVGKATGGEAKTKKSKKAEKAESSASPTP